MWDADLLHVQHAYIEPDDDEVQTVDENWGWNHGGAPEPDVVRKQAEAEAPSGILRTEDFQSTLYFLDESDIAHLKRAVEQEYELDLPHNVLTKLLDLLELQEYAAVRGEVISTLKGLIPHFLGQGDFRLVAYLLEQSKSMTTGGCGWSPEHRYELASLPDKLSEPEVVNQLFQSLDDEVADPSEEELDALFAELSPQALGTVLEWFARASSDSVSSHVHRAAERLGTAEPQRLRTLLKGDDEPRLLAALQVASWVNAAPLVPAVADRLHDNRVAVRRAAAKALAFMGIPAAMERLELCVRDRDREVRITVVKALGERKHRAALPLIKGALDGHALGKADVYERRTFFEAYARLAGATGVGLLTKKLRGRRLLKLQEEPTTRACAAIALGIIRNDAAKGALTAARDDRHPLVRSAVDIALSGKRLW